MVIRTARKGPNRGNQFWGCSSYPKCRGIVSITIRPPTQTAKKPASKPPYPDAARPETNENTKPNDRIKQTSKIRLDPYFIRRLLEKLKVGNRRSIHLSAPPGNQLAKLDLFDLGQIDPEMPGQFITTLLSRRTFKFPISLKGLSLEEQAPIAKTSKRLNHLVLQDREDFLELGQKNFAFGWPLLIKNDQANMGKVIKAPLLIWDLEITKSDHEKNTWGISRNEDAPITVNQLLTAYIGKDEGIELPKLPEDALEDGLLDQNELVSFCQQTLKALGSDFICSDIPPVSKCLETKEFDQLHQEGDKKPWLSFCGVFGLYKSPKESIIQATEQVLDESEQTSDQQLELGGARQSLVASVATNPSQEEIINTLINDEFKLIQGPPGTGKSQSIAAIISNALANDNRVLLICEKKEALNVVYQKLEEVGLGEFAVVIDSSSRDRKEVVERARRVRDQHASRGVRTFDQIGFNNDHEDFVTSKEDYNRRHKNALEKILGHRSRKDLIGHHLKNSRQQTADSPRGQLDDLGFEFKPEEFDQIDRQLKQAQGLYGKLDSQADRLFRTIDSDIFNNQLTTETHQRIRQAIDNGLKQIEVSRQLIGQINTDPESELVAQTLSNLNLDQIEAADGLIKNLLSTLTTISNKLQQFRQQNPDVTYERLFIKGPVPLIGRLSGKNREVVKCRNDLNSQIRKANDLRARLVQMKPTGSPWPKLKSLESFESFNQQFESSWHETAKMGQTMARIIQIRQAIIDQNRQIENSETSSLLKIPTPGCSADESINAPEIAQAYIGMETHLNQIRENFYQFDDYHAWRFYLTKCEPLTLEVLSKLMPATPHQDWSNCFVRHYNEKALHNHEKTVASGFNTSDEPLKRIEGLSDRLSRKQIDKIRNIWDSKRDGLIRAQANFNLLYNLRGSKGSRRNSLRKIIDRDFDLFTAIFPVILTNPSTANTLFPPKAGLFDFVIFDEASQLRIEDTFVNLIMGRHKVISGDEHQMPPSNYFASEHVKIGDGVEEDEDADLDYSESLVTSESLLQYAENVVADKTSKSHLDYHYRSQHPYLIAFSNHAIYGKNLITRLAKTNYNPIDFQNIGGTYRSSAHADPNLRNTNLDEARAILSILKDDVGPDNDGKHPSVGIVTFNIPQRNLINDLISQEASENAEFAAKYQAIKEAGFFLRSVESVQGDERDIIIICTTFGPQENGKFLQNFGPTLSRENSYRLLNVLITRSKQKIYVRTSIPTEHYRRIPDVGGNDGKRLLYACLHYFELISSDQFEAADQLLEELSQGSHEESRGDSQMSGLTESPFEDEVYQELKQIIPEPNIRTQYEVAGFRLDFLIDNNIVLECDGKTYHQSEEAYKHDIYRQKELEGMGFIFHRIWSTNWFRNKENEIRRFIDFYQSNAAQNQSLSTERYTPGY